MKRDGTTGTDPARRGFLAAAGAGLATAAVGKRLLAATKVPQKPQGGAPGEKDVQLPPGGVMPKRRLGRTGVDVSLLGLGGYHIGLPPDEQTAIRIVRMAIDHGVTFLDNCWDYNDGKSQVWMGHALRDGYRQKAFLMTKIDGRTRASAADQIDQCLRSFGTDVIDLLQIHEVVRMSDPDRVFGRDGAIEALVAAKKAGKIRFIGFTGHKSPSIHLKMLATAKAHGFAFDTVQMPLNVMDAHYDSFERVLPEAKNQDMGVLGMKPLGSGLFFKSTPLARRTVTPTECLHYAMGLPTSVVITGCDTVGILKQALAAAYGFQPAPDGERRALLGKTAEAAARGEWERYKTSQMFDGTTWHPWWLETASLQR
jgi:aryl-alcohol dehydrogenase-like predicted oxidoreductase